VTIYVKVNGAYQAMSRPYVHVNGVYAPANDVYLRRAGAYVNAYHYDVTPPAAPLVSTELVEHRDAKGALTGRFIRVGVRLVGTANDPNARLVRVLTNNPSSSEIKPVDFNGGMYTQGSDNTWPHEPWSEWRYNSYGDHTDTSVINYKQWPPNATAATDLTNNKTYWFVAWSFDQAWNPSPPTVVSVNVPKASVVTDSVITKEARFQANSAGSFTAGAFQSGKLIQDDSPRSRGLWMYGNQLSEVIGSQGVPTIKSAQIYIKREADTGSPSANLHLFWTPYGSVGSLTGVTSIQTNDMHKIGTLAKGEGGWFDLPPSFYADLNKNVKGMGLNYKDYTNAAAYPADYSVVQQLADNMRCGELYVVWQEAP
jgi:hypothetical protein